MARPASPSSSAFFAVCMLQAAAAAACGAMMIFYLEKAAAVGHGPKTAHKLRGSTAHDQLLIQTSDSFAGLLLIVIGFLLFMVGFVRDRDFQGFFAKGCVGVHISMMMWRVCFERRVEELARDLPRQVAGDFVLSLSWILFLVYSWREKYD